MQNTRRLTCVKDSGTIMELVMDYPPLLPDVLQQTREEFEREAKMAMAVKLCAMKRLSSGMAARLAGSAWDILRLKTWTYGSDLPGWRSRYMAPLNSTR